MTVGRAIVVTMLVIASSCPLPATEIIDSGKDLDLAVSALESDAEAESAELDELLSCHDLAVGGDRIRSLSTIDLELEIEEPKFRVRGIYTASRTGQMRIDIFAEDRRVFSEWLEDGRAWQLLADADDPIPASADGTAALRHGLEQPGRFWTLADMRDRGHRLELAGSESRDGKEFRVLKLTLSDGFEVWYWVNELTCLIERSRDFRAFHPDLEPEKSWTETIHDRFERIDGIVRPMRSRTIDFESGNVLGTTTVVDVTHSFSRD